MYYKAPHKSIYNHCGITDKALSQKL